ncbi:MAG TPA: glycosyltransferase [Gallionella sp.]
MTKISVVIPTYNRAAYLDQAITSVLSQTNADFEVVISDNCSQDETVAVVSRYLADPRVRYYRNEQNIGMVRNWHKAVFELAVGEWFMLLSDDDYLVDPEYLAKASRLIEGDSSLVMVYAGGYLLDENTGRKETLNLPFAGIVDGVDVFVSRNTVKPLDFTLCNVVFNRKLARELNGFSNPDNLSCDSELFLKMAILGHVGVINEPVSVYRFHSGNLLKKIIRSPDLMYGNMEHLVSPYLFARNRIRPEQMETFKKNTTLGRFVTNTLLLVACYSWGKFLKYREETLSAVPELSLAEMQTLKFRIKLLICRIGGRAVPVIMGKI